MQVACSFSLSQLFQRSLTAALSIRANKSPLSGRHERWTNKLITMPLPFLHSLVFFRSLALDHFCPLAHFAAQALLAIRAPRSGCRPGPRSISATILLNHTLARFYQHLSPGRNRCLLELPFRQRSPTPSCPLSSAHRIPENPEVLHLAPGLPEAVLVHSVAAWSGPKLMRKKSVIAAPVFSPLHCTQARIFAHWFQHAHLHSILRPHLIFFNWKLRSPI